MLKKLLTEAKTERLPSGTRYTFGGNTIGGGPLVVDLRKINSRNSPLIKTGIKTGKLTSHLPTFWAVDTYAYTSDGDCLGLFNPTRNGREIEFSWILEATEENKERILLEILRQAYKKQN